MADTTLERPPGCVCGSRLTTTGQLVCPVHGAPSEERKLIDVDALEANWFMQHTRLESEALSLIANEMARANDIALKRLQLETAKLELAASEAKRGRDALAANQNVLESLMGRKPDGAQVPRG